MSGKKTPAELKRAKYADIMRKRGTPLMVTPEEVARCRAHVRALHDRGMSYAQIAETSPRFMHDTNVAKVIREYNATIHRDTYEALMRTHYVEPDGFRSGRRVDSTGVRRRMRALVADGFGYNVLGEFMGISGQAVYQLCTREAPTFAATLAYVDPVYRKLAGKSPAAYGATKLGVTRALAVARRKDWAPSHCWDSDTIDDPGAFPEWTGACGTVTGYNIHRSERIRVAEQQLRGGGKRVQVLCGPCCEARVTRKSDYAARLAEKREDVVRLLGEGVHPEKIAPEVGLSVRTVERIKKEQ